jgi:AraC-like DNA-binding protein
MKGLIHITLQPKTAFIQLVVFFVFCNFNYVSGQEVITYGHTNAHLVTLVLESPKLLRHYNILAEKGVSDNMTRDQIERLKELAIQESEKGNAQASIDYMFKYIGATADISIINDHLFINIANTSEYINFKQKYSPTFKPIAMGYFYVGFLGLFIFLMMNMKKNHDRIGTLLISLFVLFHSFFILHLSIYIINYQYHLPHTLFISTTFSFLYGPLLYFYFKRITYNYKFRPIDFLHLLPSAALFVYLIPFYLLSSLDKFKVIFDQSNLLLPGADVIIAVKILSLSVYAILSYKIYKSNRNLSMKKNKNKRLWQRNIIFIFVTYILVYVFYAASIKGIIYYPQLFNLQIVVMASLVLYVAYISYLQPEVFKGRIKLIDPVQLFDKYKNSGLTASYSMELKDKLLLLFNEEKIFKQNDLSLELLSNKLNTSRHNTSQVINEHFGLNFFELVNSFRINEAQEILKNDTNNNFNIIEVAYEVGFNNKVTFNKSFKKQVEKTPTQFIKSLRFS